MIETLPQVFADESGNTGEDLLSLDQPIFAVGSVHLSDEAAETLLSSTEIGDRREWKFSRLRRSGPGRRAILQVLEGLDSSSAKWAAAHKRYMICCKLVDELLEPVLKDAGVDLYDRSGQVVVANAWFEAIPTVLGEGEADNFYRSFVEMFRRRSVQTIDEFYEKLRMLAHSLEGPLTSDLEILIESRPYAERFLIKNPSAWDVLDPAQPFLLPLLSAWGDELGTPFSVIHDQVKGADRWQHMMKPFLFSDLPRREVGYGERTWALPLFATGVSFADSKDFAQLQIADLVAGAANYWLAGINVSPDNQSFHDSLTRAGIFKLVVLALWPESGADFDEADAAAAFQPDPPSQAAAFVREWEASR